MALCILYFVFVVCDGEATSMRQEIVTLLVMVSSDDSQFLLTLCNHLYQSERKNKKTKL